MGLDPVWAWHNKWMSGYFDLHIKHNGVFSPWGIFGQVPHYLFAASNCLLKRKKAWMDIAQVELSSLKLWWF